MPGYNNPDDYLEELDPITLGMDPEENRVPVRGGFSGTAIGSKDPLDATGYTSALDRVQQATAARPKRPEPKWWQRLAAGAAGFAGGYINADPHNRPVDMSPVADEILAPGYRRKMGEWKEGVETAKSDADLEGKKLTAREAIARIQGEGKMRDAQIAAAEARKAAAERALKASPKPDYSHLKEVSGGLYDARDGKWIREPNAKASTPHWVEDAQGNVRLLAPPGPGDVAPPEPINYGRVGKGKQPREVDPLVEELRAQRLREVEQKAAEGVDKQKTDGESQILSDREKDIDSLLKNHTAFDTEADVHRIATDPKSAEADRQEAIQVKQAIQGINRKYAQRLQQAQNSYARNIRARGGSADDFTVDPDTLEYKKGASPAPKSDAPKVDVAIPRAFPRAKLAEVAKRAGISEQEAERQLKSENWIIQ